MRLRALLLSCLVLAGPVARAQGAADKPLAATLRRRFTVGGAADASFAPAMLFPQFVATDNAGHLFVVDRAESRVIEYDAKGTQVRIFGRKGRGPGELAAPFAIGVEPDGSIAVSDGGKRALVRFAADGRILPEIPARELGFIQEIVSVTDDAYTVYASVRDSSLLLRLRGEKVERIAGRPPVPRRPTPVYEKPCGLIGSEASPLLHEMLRAAGRGNVMVYSTASTWAFTVVEPGKAPRVISRNRAPERLTAEMARRILGDSSPMFVGNRRCAVPMSAVIEQAGMAEFKPPYERFVLDGKGFVWATRMTAEGDSNLSDVYSLAKGYIGTVNLGKAKPVAFLSDGALVSLETDSDDAPILVIYEVTRWAP